MAEAFKFELTGSAADELAHLARRMGVPPAEALTRALANQSFFLEERARGAEVLIRKADRSLLKVETG